MFEELKDIGFTDGEIKVYWAMVRLKRSSIGLISKESGITPAKTYIILDKLLKKGLIAKIKEGNIMYFILNNPERLLTYLDEKKFELEEKREKIERDLPKIKFVGQGTDTRVLKGWEGLKTFYEEHNRLLLKGDKVFRVFSFEDDWKKDNVKLFIQKQDLIRKELGIEVRVIANLEIKKYIKKQEYKLVKIRFTDSNLPVGTVVSDNQVALMTIADEPTVVVIDSKDIGQAYTRFFEDLWKKSK